jgi:uncharacterized C2H2 Zn-finger protein
VKPHWAIGETFYKCPRCSDTGWTFTTPTGNEVTRCSRCFGPELVKSFGERE